MKISIVYGGQQKVIATLFTKLCVWGLVDLSLISRLGVGRTAFRDFGDGGITRLRWFIGWAELGTWVYH